MLLPLLTIKYSFCCALRNETSDTKGFEGVVGVRDESLLHVIIWAQKKYPHPSSEQTTVALHRTGKKNSEVSSIEGLSMYVSL